MPELRSLTSLRFLAAMAIVFGHIYPVTDVPLGVMHHVLLAQGVSFFFILSGFILSFTYDKADLKRGKWQFYQARIARVYPLYLIALLFSFYVLSRQFGNYVFTDRTVWMSVAIEAVALQAWFPSGVIPINGVGWSVSAEAFFYAVFPMVKRSRRAFAALLVLAVTATGLVCLFGQGFGLKPGTGPGSFFRITYLSPLVRSIEFLFGVWLGTRFAKATVLSRASAAWPSLLWTLAELASAALCVGASAYSFSNCADPAMDLVWGGAWSALLFSFGASPCFGLLVWVFAHERGLASRSLRGRPFVLLGAASYALYLFHERVFAALLHDGWLPLAGSVPVVQQRLVSASLLTILLGAAFAAHLLIERPARRWLRQVSLRTQAGSKSTIEPGGRLQRRAFPWTILSIRGTAPPAQ